MRSLTAGPRIRPLHAWYVFCLPNTALSWIHSDGCGEVAAREKVRRDALGLSLDDPRLGWAPLRDLRESRRLYLARAGCSAGAARGEALRDTQAAGRLGCAAGS